MSADSHPSLGELLLEAVDLAIGRLHVRIPGVVVSQDPSTLRCTIRPAVRARTKDVDTDDLIPFELPTLRDVPVAYPRGGGMVMTWPLSPGDSVWLVYCDRSMDEWRDGASAPVTPADPRRFSLTDAVAVPTASRDTEVVSSATAAAVTAGALVLDHDDIRLGGPAATAVALAVAVDARLDAIEAFLGSHTHGVAGVTAGMAAVVSAAPVGAPSGGSTAATTTKAV